MSLDERPAVLVSSTSWTADEDFTILLRALSVYETAAREPDAGLPRLLAIVTGKGGPLRAAFEREAERLERTEDWRFVRARTTWLERDDYPRLLGAADVGVSLHASTSGFDLPMKVVDMFGCGLPVLALDFPACVWACVLFCTC
jgi:beta-1,4-mannosyltransferase